MKCVNNISCANNTVLLRPSINEVMGVLHIREKYVEAHKLKHKVKKSDLLVVKADKGSYPDMPGVKL